MDGREVLAWAMANRCAAGSFNTYNIEISRAIIAAAESASTPIFLSIGVGALDHGGVEALTAASLAMAEGASVPVALHLDHASDLSMIERCVDAGFTSVMVDGSHEPLGENIALSAAARRLVRDHALEAELGGIEGAEDRSGDALGDEGATAPPPMTDVREAERFIAETTVDSLAVAIGNAHGRYRGTPRLDFGRLAQLEAVATVPLVLHGASGLSDPDILECIATGIRKINVNTEIRQTLFASLGAALGDDHDAFDVPALFGRAIVDMSETVSRFLHLFCAPAGS